MRGIEKRFGATRALRGIELEVYPGEVLALVGENGAGKSTLMKVISGAHQADAGEMWIEGRPYQPKNPLNARHSGIGMIYQELSLASHLSVEENILLGSELTRGPFINRKATRAKAREALAEIGLTDVQPDTKVSNLSIARQQMVEIARAIALDCKLLVLDEPTSSLTQSDIEQLFSLIRRLREKQIAIIYISHFLEEVKTISDRITVLRDGESVGDCQTAQVGPDEIFSMMVGRDVGDLYPRSKRDGDAEVVLEIKDMAGVTKPKSCSLQLKRGRVLGICGLVGTGRTEMMRAIFGLDPVKQGQIRIGLFDGAASPARRWQQGVGMVSEDRKREGLALNLSIADNLTLPKLDGLGPGRFVTPGRQHKASSPLIEKMEVKCTGPQQKMSSLSGGNQQKVAIARLLHADVDVLLLDEPTRGIDVGSKAQIYKLIDELALGVDGKTEPKAILVISSYLPELLGICDEIAVMARGELQPAQPVSQWNEEKLMLAATGQQTTGN